MKTESSTRPELYNLRDGLFRGVLQKLPNKPVVALWHLANKRFYVFYSHVEQHSTRGFLRFIHELLQ
ncbi:multicopper oxidase domain-containing protein [Phaeocystidibacter luteus]|uniref:multicopper oxidase domain-containing protein n=1 Tax=Phaeocystidibacter luteus TaxID=911197 RepID=UPI00389A98ED